MTNDYNLAIIHNLLLAAFTADELRRFCRDHPTYRPLLADVPGRATLNEIADALIQYCETRALLDDLCAAIKETNPRQYKRFAPDLHAPYESLSRSTGLRLGTPTQAPPWQLPPRAVHFVNRTAQLDRILTELRPNRVMTLWGLVELAKRQSQQKRSGI